MMTFDLPILPFPTLRELKRIAKEYGYRKYSLLTRDQLLDLLSGPPPMKVKDLKEKAKELGLKGYSWLRKAELEVFLTSYTLDDIKVKKLRETLQKRKA